MIRRPEPRGRIVLLILAMLALLLVLSTARHAADAQPAGRVYRLGYLGEGRSENAPLLRPLWDGLRELGYVEGRNLVIEQRRLSMREIPVLSDSRLERSGFAGRSA